jgi:hypothetical protein
VLTPSLGLRKRDLSRRRHELACVASGLCHRWATASGRRVRYNEA